MEFEEQPTRKLYGFKCIYQIARRIIKEEQSKHTGWKETSYVLTGPE